MIKEKIITEYFEELGLTNPTNQILIDELLFCIEQIDILKEKIKIDGSILIDSKENTSLNPALLAYQKLIATIQNLCSKLAMTVQDRSKLKLLKKEDAVQLEFENFMNEKI
jgi:P27 family predicted phage terminase small subunit